MKNLFFICWISLLLSGCNKDDDTSNDDLPPATTTGAGTFACKVNGQSFIDPGSLFNCYYQFIDDGYDFGISGKDEDYKYTNLPWGLHLRSENVVFEEGQTYQLLHEEDDNVIGDAVFSLSPNDFYSQETSAQYTGELTITKFGTGSNPHIIAGTFWFNVQHPTTGETVHITEGRFDTMYLE